MYMQFLDQYRKEIIMALPTGAAYRISKAIEKPHNTVMGILKGKTPMIPYTQNVIEKVVELAIEEIERENQLAPIRAKVVTEFSKFSH